MIVYLMRHGRAAQSSPDGPRELTEKGREEVAKVAEHFKKEGLTVTQAWHSSKTRAIQTCEIFLKTTGFQAVPVEEHKELKPEGDTDEIYGEIEKLKEGSLLIVSHMPFVAGLAATLVDGAGLSFPTAGLAAFERKGKDWKFLWSWDPAGL